MNCVNSPEGIRNLLLNCHEIRTHRMIPRKYPPEITRLKMVAWCNKAERCQWDIRNKLINWNIPSRERESLIAELIENNLLNESRYAAAYAHDKAAFNQWGAKKIEMFLKAKGISERNIKDALKTINQEDEIAIIDKLILKKAPQFNGLKGYQKRFKLMRFMLSRGFNHEVISIRLDLFFED